MYNHIALPIRGRALSKLREVVAVMSRRRASGWIKFHVVVFAALATFVVISGKGMTSRSVFDGDIPKSDPRVASYHLVKEITPADNWVGLVLSHPDTIYNQQTLNLVVTLTRALEEMPEIVPGSVRSLTTVHGFVGKEALSSEPLMGTDDADKPERVRGRVHTHPIARKEMVSADERHLILGGYLTPDFDQKTVADQLRSIARQHSGQSEVLPFGLPFINQELDEGILSQAVVFTIATLGIMLLIFWQLGMLKAGLVMFGCMVLGIVETNLFMVMLGIPESVVSSAIPTLLVALGIAYFFYFTRQAANANGTIEERVGLALRVLAMPTWLSAIATMIGFGSLAWSFQILSLKEFGLVTAIGVGLIVWIARTLFPAVCVLKPSLIPQAQTQSGNKHVEWITLAILNASQKPLGKVLAVVFFAGLLCGIVRLDVNTNPYEFFPKDHLVTRSVRVLETISGTSETIVAIHTADSPLQADVLTRLLRLEQEIEKLPKVQYVSGLGKLTQYATDHLYPGSDKLPEGVGAILEMSVAPTDLDRLINQDRTVVYLRVWSSAKTTDEVAALIREIRSKLQNTGFDYNDVAVTGSTQAPFVAFGGYDALWVAINDYIVEGKIWNLVSSLWGIWILAFFFVGQRREGVWKLVRRATVVTVPLGVALVATMGVMGWLNVPLDLASCVITAVGIGVGEDFAIHFLHHYRRHGSFAAAARDMGDLLLYALLTAGGFASFAFSAFLPLRQFAWLVCVILILSYLAAALCVPPLVKLFGIEPERKMA